MKYGHEVGMNSPLRAGDQFAVSEIAALAVVDLLASHDIQAQIKWPNDIYVADRKICGILIENSVRDGFMSSSIIGIGLNVNQTDFDPLLPNPTSMALCRPSFDQPGESEPWHPLPLEPLLEEFMDIFKGYCSRYLNITGGLTRLRRLYLSQMWRKDIEADYMDISEARSFKGIIKGLTDIGLLIVEDIEKGELREFAFKEIGYMI